MFIVDEQYDLDAISIMAAHAESIDPRVEQILEEHWTGKASQDFLRGLVVGYANSHALFTQEPELAREEAFRPVSTLAAFAARKLLEQLDSDQDPLPIIP